MRRVLCALACAAVAVPAAPARAVTYDAAVVSGIGGITPPAGPVPQPVEVTFGGSALLLGTPRQCSLRGPAIESTAAGTGTLTGGCGDVAMVCTYERAGAAMTWHCTTDTMGVLVGTLTYRPLNVNPTSIYALLGVLAGATSV